MNAQYDWKELPSIFSEVYKLAEELNEKTDKVVANGDIISVTTNNGTISVQQELDKSVKPELKHYQYKLITTNGKNILLDKMNSKRVIESFQAKLLTLREQLRVNQDADVESILKDLFSND